MLTNFITARHFLVSLSVYELQQLLLAERKTKTWIQLLMATSFVYPEMGKQEAHPQVGRGETPRHLNRKR